MLRDMDASVDAGGRGTALLHYDGPSTRQQHSRSPKRKWSHIRNEHTYVTQWSLSETRHQDFAQETCSEPFLTDSGVQLQVSALSKRVPMYNEGPWSRQFVNRRNRFGETKLHQAVMKSDLAMIQAIIKLRSDVNMADYSGRTPLHEAALRGQYHACVELITAGADVNASGRGGVTPLHHSVQNGHVQLTELLLKHGADPWLMNDRGEAAFGLSTDPCLRSLMLDSSPAPTPKRRKRLQWPNENLPPGEQQTVWDPESDVSRAEWSRGEPLEPSAVSAQLSDPKLQEELQEELLKELLEELQVEFQEDLLFELQEELQGELLEELQAEIQMQSELELEVEDLVPLSASSSEPAVKPSAVGQGSPSEQDYGENSDSDQTLFYLSSLEEEDWSCQDMQNFICPHGGALLYNFPL